MIAIAGGTGRLGRLVAADLASRGERVRVLTRDPSRVSAELRDRVEIVRADVRDASSLKAAVRGSSTVISAITGFGGPDAGGANVVDRDGNVALVAAASNEGVSRFVLLSVLGAAADSPVALFRAKHAAEQALLATTMEPAIVRPTAYVETWLEIVGRPLADTGSTRVFGRGRNPVNFVSADDVAAIVVALATGPAPSNPAVTLAGPEDLTLDELAACAARAIGVEPRIEHTPPAMMRLLAAVLGPVRPVFADQLRAALLMDGADMRASAADRRSRFPLAPVTTADAVAARLFTTRGSAAVAGI